MKFRKKPVVIEAYQFTGQNTNWIADWCNGTVAIQRTEHNKCIVIHTLEGSMRADIGDWIIKGVNKEGGK